MASTVAAYAMTVVVLPADAPLLDYKNPAYSPNHLLNVTPITGVRGDVRILKAPFVG